MANARALLGNSQETLPAHGVSSLTVAESSDSGNQAEIRKGQGQMRLAWGNRSRREVAALYL
jgi:hypothetical protein